MAGAEWRYWRDEVNLDTMNAVIAAETAAGRIGTGTKLIIGGRSVTQSTPWAPPTGSDVVVIADTYQTPVDSSGNPTTQASIDVSGHVGTVGSSGTSGQPGAVTGKSARPGGTGGTGGAGGQGSAGGSATLFAQTLFPCQIVATGGAGGPGGPGGGGGPGIRPTSREIKGNLVETPGAQPGGGGNGGAGGRGGPGGTVTVEYVHPGVIFTRMAPAGPLSGVGSPLTVNGAVLAGGLHGGSIPVPHNVVLNFLQSWVAGGHGGAGGRGGGIGANSSPDSEGPSPAAGQAGVAGPNGNHGTLTVRQTTTDAYWQALYTTVGVDALSEWAQYRFDVGQYYFRSSIPAQEPGQGFLALARGEFAAVQKLCAAPGAGSTMQSLAGRAAEQIKLIDNGCNALGMPPWLTLKPDVEELVGDFDQQAQFAAPVLGELATTITAGTLANEIGSVLSAMNVQLANAQAALQADVAAATDAQQIAVRDQQHINDQLGQAQSQLATQKQDLATAQMKLADGTAINDIFGALNTVISIAGTASGVLGYVGVIGNVVGLTAGQIQTVGNVAGKLKTVGGLGSMASGIEGFFGYGPAAEDAEKATITNDEANIRQLTQQCVDLAFQAARQQLEVNMAAAQLTAANDRVAANAADVNAINGLSNANLQDRQTLADVIETLLKDIARCGAEADAFAYLCARALDILTFADASVLTPPPAGHAAAAPVHLNAANLPVSLGVVSPDRVADAMLSLTGASGGSTQNLLTLITDVNASWSQSAEAWSTFAQECNTLIQEYSSGEFWVTFHRADWGPEFDALQATGVASFPIQLSDLPGNAAEVHVEEAWINLIGVTGSEPTGNCSLRHGGYAKFKRRDDAVLLVDAPARTDGATVGFTSGEVPASAAKKPPRPDAAGAHGAGGGAAATAVAAAPRTRTAAAGFGVQWFYGRSPATAWTVDLTSAGLNLANLTAVEFGFTYFGLFT